MNSRILDVACRYWRASYESIRYPNGQQSNVVTLIHRDTRRISASQLLDELHATW
ncbi:hypothetical protein BGY98DRAFT_959271, partial [Russula aff. rugulosa BPL654]